MEKMKLIAVKGSGYFGIVKLIRGEETGQDYALKEIKKEHYSSDDGRYRFIREIQLLRELQGCDNIIEILNYEQDHKRERLWYLMPFAKYNLHDYIKKNNQKLPIEQRFGITEQILNALKFAHNKGIIHRDISPTNILIFESNEAIQIKVADFGLGKSYESLSYYTNSSANNYGQILYVSPEQREKLKDSTTQSDIYSLGKLIYFIFTGKDPIDLKPFEFSSLVSKAIEENPNNRFQSIEEFEERYCALKKLHFESQISEKYITLNVILENNKNIDWATFHRLVTKNAESWETDFYSGYVMPVIYFLTEEKLLEYFSFVGDSIIDFVAKFAQNVSLSMKGTGWEFSSMSDFGNFFTMVYKKIPIDAVRNICIKNIWFLAYEADRWSVGKNFMDIAENIGFPSMVEGYLAEYILGTQMKYDIPYFTYAKIPARLKAAIISVTTTEIEKQQKTITDFK